MRTFVVPARTSAAVTPLRTKKYVQSSLGFQIALAWLLHRSPTTLLIPGTSSVDHLRENIEGAGIELPTDALEKLNTINK